MKKLHKYLLTGAVMLGLGASAMAADPVLCDGPMGMQGKGQGQRWAQMDPAKRAEFMKARIEQHHAVLHDKLKLNASQEVAWKAFIAGAQPPMMDMPAQRADMQKLSAPERMEKMLEFMKARQAHMTARLVELKKFYAVLTPEQQKIFDAETMRGPRGRGMPRGSRNGPAPASAPK